MRGAVGARRRDGGARTETGPAPAPAPQAVSACAHSAAYTLARWVEGGANRGGRRRLRAHPACHRRLCSASSARRRNAVSSSSRPARARARSFSMLAQPISLAGELEPDHLLGVGALARVPQRTVMLRERRRQLSGVGLRVRSSSWPSSATRAARSRRGRRRRSSGPARPRALVRSHAAGPPGPPPRARTRRRSGARASGRSARRWTAQRRPARRGPARRQQQARGVQQARGERPARGGPALTGAGRARRRAGATLGRRRARAIAAGTRKLIRHVPGIIPVSPGGSGIAGIPMALPVGLDDEPWLPRRGRPPSPAAADRGPSRGRRPRRATPPPRSRGPRQRRGQPWRDGTVPPRTDVARKLAC